MNLDKKIDEILIDFDTWCLCKADECVLAQNFKQAKQAIKQLIEEQVTESYKKGYIDRGIEEITIALELCDEVPVM